MIQKAVFIVLIILVDGEGATEEANVGVVAEEAESEDLAAAAAAELLLTGAGRSTAGRVIEDVTID